MHRSHFLVVGLVLVAACSSSSAPPAKPDSGARDGSGSGSSSGSGSGGGGGGDGGGCASSKPCTGSLSGGVEGTFTSCTLSGEQGVTVGFGEVTFDFAVGSGISGSGNVSTKGKFAAGSYSIDAGLWNDTPMSGGAAADSLWQVTAPGDGGAPVTAECNGIASPDETPNLCQGSVLDVKSVDSCSYIHGTLTVGIPAFRGEPAVTLNLSF